MGFREPEGEAREMGAQASPLCALAPRLLLHTSFLSPLFILWLWTKPIARDFLHQAPFGGTPYSLCVWGGAGREGSWGPLCVLQSPKLREEAWALGENPWSG